MDDDLVEAAKEGREAGLHALRNHLAAALLSADTKDIAALSRQLQAVLKDLEDYARPDEGSAVDDLKSRRAQRRAAASAQ